ncbi:tetratricopeptide repeat protein [Nonomuraea longicatena]|uniref:tetratricopeptide repeat protein n=1 Tax=Nonomuraea longicatena TaxID=83682 RepID=UPI0031D0C335
MTRPTTRHLLDELGRANLVTEPSPGRTSMDDLLRAYAAALTIGRERQEAPARLHDHYAHSAQAAALALSPHRFPILTTTPLAGVTPERFSGADEAVAWFQAEHHLLMSRTFVTWQSAWAVHDFLDRRGRWQEQSQLQRAALATTLVSGDRVGQAHTRRNLGWAHARLGRPELAHAHLAYALDLFEALMVSEDRHTRYVHAVQRFHHARSPWSGRVSSHGAEHGDRAPHPAHDDHGGRPSRRYRGGRVVPPHA